MSHCKWCKNQLVVSEEGGDACHNCWEVESRLRMMPSSVLQKICEHHGYTLLDNGNLRSAAQ